MNPLALVGSLLVHGVVVAAMLVTLPQSPTRLEMGDAWTVELVTLEEATNALEAVPVAAAPLPELQATRTPDPSPSDTQPTPEPAGAPTPPVATAAEAAPEVRPAPTATPVPRPASEPTPAPTTAPAEVAAAPLPEATATSEAEPTPPPLETSTPAASPTPEPEPQVAQDVSEPATAVEAATVNVPGSPRRRPDAPQQVAAATPPPETRTPGAPQPNPDARQTPREEEDPLDALLQSVEQMDRRVQAEVERDTSGRAEAVASGQGTDMRVQQLGRLIYDQIIGCWTVPAGLDGLRQVGPVEIRTEFGPGGDVVRATVENQQRLQTDRVFRSVAESAERAIRSCTPLRNMPADLYPQWRLTILVFDPTQITAGG